MIDTNSVDAPLAVFHHDQPVNYVAISADNKFIVTASDDHKIRVWSSESPTTPIKVLRGHTNAVKYVKITPDCKRIVSVSKDRSVMIWDIEQRNSVDETTPTQSIAPKNSDKEAVEMVKKIKSLCKGVIRCTAISIDGRWAVTGGGDPQDLADTNYEEKFDTDYALRLWDVNSLTCIYERAGHTDSISTVAITPDSRFILSGGTESMEAGKPKNPIIVWDLKNGRKLYEIENHKAATGNITTSPDGKVAVAYCKDSDVFPTHAGEDFGIYIWNIECGISSIYQLSHHSNWITSLKISPDGRKLVSGGDDNTICIWDLESGSREPIHVLEEHKMAVTSLTITPDGKRIISGSNDHTIRVWDINSGECLYILPLSFSPKAGVITLTEIEVGGEEGFMASHENLLTSPLIATAMRDYGSEGNAVEPATAYSPCCGKLMELTEYVTKAIESWDSKETEGNRPEEGFYDPSLLIECPSCKTKLRLNPFFIERHEEINSL